MYSEEIKRLLEIKRNLVTLKEYIDIVSSPQVDHVLYKDDWFHLWTTDGYKFVLKIKI